MADSFYRARFGIRAAPFQLTPDPAFYFDNAEHRRVLSELSAALAHGADLVAVSGEIGTGKTTLCGTLIDQLAYDGFATARVVSTQLDADDLLFAAATAFGVGRRELPAAAAASLQRWLLAMANERRRAVLLVDEAQHLDPSALQTLQQLAAMRPLGTSVLQVVLAGQPELATTLASATMRPLAAALGAHSRIAPLDLAGTRGYIEHRLQMAGWTGTPVITDDAFEAVFQSTRGVPRRINLLCNRLLLASYIADGASIDGEAVRSAAGDLRAECGDSVPAGLSPAAATPRQRPPKPRPEGPWWCVVDGQSDHLQAAALMRAMAGHDGLQPVQLVRVRDNDALQRHGAAFAALSVAPHRLGLPAQRALPVARVVAATEALIARERPRGVVVFGGSEAAAACAFAARDSGAALVHMEADRHGRADTDLAQVFTDQLSQWAYTGWDTTAGDAVKAARCVGSLAADAVLYSLAHMTPALEGAAQRLLPDEAMRRRRGYAVAAFHQRATLDHAVRLGTVVETLRDIARDLPLIWPMHGEIAQRLVEWRHAARLEGSAVHCVPMQSHGVFLALMREASCVLTDSSIVCDEAALLGVPAIKVGSLGNVVDGSPRPTRVDQAMAGKSVTWALWRLMYGGAPTIELPPTWDGKSAQRLVEDLTQRIAQHVTA